LAAQARRGREKREREREGDRKRFFFSWPGGDWIEVSNAFKVREGEEGGEGGKDHPWF
jgi:hypothetical protein